MILGVVVSPLFLFYGLHRGVTEKVTDRVTDRVTEKVTVKFYTTSIIYNFKK